jgi:acylphosphatase
MPSEKKSLHLYIDGRVQGVGFRFFAQKTASRLGLKGFVRNLPDGRVETYAEGNEASLNEFLQRMQEGPGAGYVSGVEQTWGQPSGNYNSFRISY